MKQYIKESLKYFLRSKPFIKKEIKEVEKLYALTAEELIRYKEKRFLTIFRRAITKSKFYKDFYADAGIEVNDIQSLRDIEKLPILTKDVVRKNNLDMLTVSRKRVFEAKTSGTTGTPLTIFQDYKTIKKEQAYIWVRRKNYGFKFGEPLVSLRGNLGYNKLKLYIHISNTLFLSSYNINRGNSLKYYSEIKKFKPKAIEGYPSSLYNLCIFLKEEGLSLNIPLAFTSSETLYDFQRILIEDVLHTKIYDRYGCTEKTISLAQNINGNGYYGEPAYSINEYRDNCVYTTSLMNDSFPLIRYVVNDKIETVKKEQEVDIVAILGRNEDVIFCKDGTRVGRIDHIFKGAQNIVLAQIIQSEIGTIDVNIVPDKYFSESNKNAIIKNIYKKIDKENIDICINLISENDIEYSGRNKYSLVIFKK